MKDGELPIIVIGAGAVGLGIAVACNNNGKNVLTWSRSGILKQGSLTVSGERLESEFETHLNSKAIVVVAVKDYDIESVAKQFKSDLAKALVIISLQNGLGSAERLGNQKSIVRAITWACATHICPTESKWKDPIQLSFETYNKQNTFTKLIKRHLENRFIQIEFVEPSVFKVLQFKKLIVNLTANTLATHFNLNCAELLVHTEALRLAKSIASEVEALSRAFNINLQENAEDIVYRSWEKMGQFEPSMLQDMRAGRTLEFRSIIDEPLKMAAHINVPMPTVRKLRETLRNQFPDILGAKKNL